MDIKEARAYLEEVRKLDQQIAAKNEERQRLLQLAKDCSAKLPDGMPHSSSGVPRSFERVMIQVIDLAEEISQIVTRLMQHREEVVSHLEKLPALEYGVLHRYYIQYMPWEKVAETTGRSTRQIYRIRDNGLKILANVIECHL